MDEDEDEEEQDEDGAEDGGHSALRAAAAAHGPGLAHPGALQHPAHPRGTALDGAPSARASSFMHRLHALKNKATTTVL